MWDDSFWLHIQGAIHPYVWPWNHHLFSSKVEKIRELVQGSLWTCSKGPNMNSPMDAWWQTYNLRTQLEKKCRVTFQRVASKISARIDTGSKFSSTTATWGQLRRARPDSNWNIFGRAQRRSVPIFTGALGNDLMKNISKSCVRHILL